MTKIHMVGGHTITTDVTVERLNAAISDVISDTIRDGVVVGARLSITTPGGVMMLFISHIISAEEEK